LRKYFIPIATSFVLILLIARGSLWLSSQEDSSKPSARHTGPSGLSAFADALRLAGYEVRVETRTNPRFTDDETLIVPQNWFLFDFESSEDESDSTTGKITKHVQEGHGAIFLPMDYNFLENSFTMREGTVPLSIPKGSTLRISKPFADAQEANLARYERPGKFVTLARAENWNVVGGSLRRGKVAVASDATLISNRFIDKADNVAVMLGVVRTIAPAGSKIAILESYVDPYDPDVLDVLGMPFRLALYQSVFAICLIAWGLGKRFGLPDESRERQSGERELVSAIEDLVRRTQGTSLPAEATLHAAEFKIRRYLGPSQSLAQLAEQSSELRGAMRKVELLRDGKLDRSLWFETIALFESELQAAIESFK
jgi:hypothetical protein